MDAPTRWIHLFEEDGGEGAVYVPEESDVPLSRRPRERIELHSDGSASISLAGPDDRPTPNAARWERLRDSIEIRVTGTARILRVRQVSPTRWIIAPPEG